MLYTPLTNRAMRIAYDAHHGQVDKAGLPYIYHPVHLAEQMDDEISICAALLHDVVEDSPVTFQDLAAEFPSEVLNILHLLTHREDVPYFDYIRSIRENPIARKIKLADIAHNTDLSRCSSSGISQETLRALSEKYQKALSILMEKP